MSLSQSTPTTNAPVQAVILRAWQTGRYFGHDMEIGLTLEVRPAGIPPFTTTIKHIVTPLTASQFQPGQVLGVTIDPNNPRKVTITEVMLGVTAATLDKAQQVVNEIVALQTRLSARGAVATARVVAAQPMEITVNGDNPVMSCVLEVHPEGGAPFAAVAKAAIARSSVDKYAPGTLLYVKYDPQDPTQVMIDHR